MLPEEPEKVLLVSHRATGLELAEDECISPASDGVNQKWNRERVHLRSNGSSTQMRLTPSVCLTS